MTAKKRRRAKRAKSSRKRKNRRGLKYRRSIKSRNRRMRMGVRRRQRPQPIGRSERYYMGSSPRTYHVGERVRAIGSIYSGAEGVVVKDIGTGMEWRVTSNSKVDRPEYAAIGQVISTRKSYMAPR